MNRVRTLARRYGPWALVAGASEGLGSAYAHELARAGLNLVLVARREPELRATAARLEAEYGLQTRPVTGDLGSASTIERLADLSAELDLGLIVYNAASAPIGRFAETALEAVELAVQVNVLGPMRLVRGLLPAFASRDRSGVVLMSSLAGLVGSPGLATYSATKAFTTAFGQALFEELREQHVDVTVCIAGAIRTPGLEHAIRASGSREAPGAMDARDVARAALAALGRRPVIVPGITNKLARFFMSRVLSVRSALRIMAAQTQRVGLPDSSG